MPAIPTLLDDIQGRMDAWGKQGTMDPFKNIYDVRHIFSLPSPNLTSTYPTHIKDHLPNDSPHGLLPRTRIGPDCAHQIPKPLLVRREERHPHRAALPLVSRPARRAKEDSTKALFMTVWGYIEERKKALVPGSDAIDVLLGQELSNEDIIQCVLGAIFGGVVNTGINGT